MVDRTLVTEGTFQIRGKEEPIDRVDKRLGPQSVIWKQLGPALSISVAPSSLSVAPGDSPVLKLKIKNNSDKSHEVRLTFAGDGSDWFMPPSEPVKVGVHGEQAVEIPLKVPPERDRALAGNYALKVQAASQTGPAGEGRYTGDNDRATPWRGDDNPGIARNSRRSDGRVSAPLQKRH